MRAPRLRLSSLCLSVVSLCAVTAPALAETIRVESSVTSATVYPSAASVRRTARVRIAQGDHALVFGPLPLAITDDSVRLSGMGPGLITDAVTVRTGTMGELTEPTRRSLAEAVDGLAQQLRELTATRARMASNDPLRARSLPGVIAIDQRIAAVTAQHAERSRQLAALQATASTAVKFATVDVSASREGEATLSLDYAIPGGATWRPTYAAHLGREASSVALDVLASLQQSTGEDWTGVRVTVSSVNPTGALAIPTLGERVISLAPEPEREREVSDEIVLRRRVSGAPSLAGMARPSAARASMDMDMERSVPTPPPTRVEHRAASVRSNLLSARFEVAVPVTLRSGAPARRILAAHAEIPCALEHHAAPRESTAVFLAAKMRNTNAFALLSGSVALFVEDEYVGTTAMRDVGVDEELVLPFGVDPSVSVARTLATRAAVTHGARDVSAVRYDYRVSNHRASPVELVVYEQVPVSRSQGLTVRATSAQRALASRHEGDAPGVLRWSVRLLPGATDRWQLGVAVTSPRGRQIEGEVD
jgi:uncharacterized protein (TIGR02231 family)